MPRIIRYPCRVRERRRVITIVVLLASQALVGLVAAAPEVSPTDATVSTAAQRPRVGLVLSGGGARGAAHVGVLQVLEAERIPIHAVAGTSMGAVIGGLYASGLSANEIAELVASEPWREAFREPAPRERRSFRRKREDQNFLVDFRLGLQSGEFRLPKGLVAEQRLIQLLRRLTLPVAAVDDFDRLPTRYRAAATDLETGEAVELAGGDLVTAMRASLAAPGVFAPVERDGRLLVDGGLANNLPVDLARRMGVDVLIVVDVGFPLRSRASLDSVTTISNQMLSILIRRGSDAQRRTLGEHDVLLQPELGEASSFDFDIVPQAVEQGRRTAEAARERLGALRLVASDYAEFVTARLAARSDPGRIERIEIDESARRYERLLRAAFEPAIAAPLDERGDRFDAALTRLYGRGNFEFVDYRLSSARSDAEETTLALSARRNSWGPNYVRFGLNLEDDFNGGSRYNAAARFVLADIGARAAEWVWDLQIGSEPRAATEFYWPLDDAVQTFLMPSASVSARDVIAPSAASARSGYRLRTTDYGLDLGREVGNRGEWRIGVRRVTGRTRGLTDEPVPLESLDFDSEEIFGRWSYDTLDSRNFPRRGGFLTAEWRRERDQSRAGLETDLLAAEGLIARSNGRQTGVLWMSYGTALDDDARGGTLRTRFPLGGFLNLSGLTPESLSGRHFAIARVMTYRQIGRGGEGFLNVPAYLGVSLEAGNVWESRREMALDESRVHGSVFFGFDTLFGPVYLGSGFGEGGDSALYLFLGRTF